MSRHTDTHCKVNPYFYRGRDKNNTYGRISETFFRILTGNFSQNRFMDSFRLRDVCNGLLADLNMSLGKQSIIKFGIDIQLPEEFYGEPGLLVNRIRVLTEFLLTRLINGLVNIEITSSFTRQETVVIHVTICGYGARRENVLIHNELINFIQSLGFPVDYDITDDHVAFEFNHTLNVSGQAKENGQPQFRNKRLLLAEDNEINALVFLSFLEEWGVESVVAVNGEEAVAQVHNGLFTVDVILMDIHMPVLNGILATRKIRQFNPSIPIIALTASTNDEDIRQVMDAGANDYLLKPVSSSSLFLTLSKYL